MTVPQSERRTIRLRAFLGSAVRIVVEDGATPRGAVEQLDADLDRSEREDLVVLVEEATVDVLRELAGRLDDAVDD